MFSSMCAGTASDAISASGATVERWRRRSCGVPGRAWPGCGRRLAEFFKAISELLTRRRASSMVEAEQDYP